MRSRDSKASRKGRSHLEGRTWCPICDGSGLYRKDGVLVGACISCGGIGRASRSMLSGLRAESDARGMELVEDDAREEHAIRPGPKEKAEILETTEAEA